MRFGNGSICEKSSRKKKLRREMHWFWNLEGSNEIS